MIVFEKNYKDKYSIFPSYKFVNSKSYKYLNEKESKFFDIIKAAFEDIDICVFAWNKIIKHNFIKQNKILFIEGCTHGEDSLFILQLLLKNPKIYITDDILYYHVISRESSVTNIDSYNYFKQLLIFKNNLLKIFANMSVGTKENTIFNYMVDFLILLVLDLWRNIYFTRHRKEYLKELASYQEFFNNTNDNYINAIRLKKHLLMAKFHISWWYWKIIRPLAKYCIVIPYRKAKRYSRKIFNMKQNKKEI